MVRTVLVALSVAAVVAAPLAPAQAGTYKVSATVSVKLTDVSSKTASARRTTIKGKVTGGSTSGRVVRFYATNTDSKAQRRVYIGSDKLSGGKFARNFSPTDGGRYRIEVVLKNRAGTAVLASDRTSVDAFRWTDMRKFYDGGKADQGVPPGYVERADAEYAGTGKQRWSISYAVSGGAAAGFDTNGYRCKKINFKIAASVRTQETVHYRVHQGSHTILAGEEAKGSAAFDAYTNKAVRDRMQPSGTVYFDVRASTSGDPGDVRMILGLPKVFCTYPSDVEPKY